MEVGTGAEAEAAVVAAAVAVVVAGGSNCNEFVFPQARRGSAPMRAFFVPDP